MAHIFCLVACALPGGLIGILQLQVLRGQRSVAELREGDDTRAPQVRSEPSVPGVELSVAAKGAPTVSNR